MNDGGPPDSKERRSFNLKVSYKKESGLKQIRLTDSFSVITYERDFIRIF